MTILMLMPGLMPARAMQNSNAIQPQYTRSVWKVQDGLPEDTVQALAETSDHGYPVLEHVKRLVEDKIIWAPAIEGACILTTRGGDFDLHIGQDVSIGYLSHTATAVQLYLQETLTFLLLTTEAAVALSTSQKSS